MNELTASQERYLEFVKELVNQGLDRVERVLGIDGQRPIPFMLTSVSGGTAALPAVPIEAVKTAPVKRTYKKRSPKAIAGDKVGREPNARKHHQGRQGQSATGPIMRPVEGVRQAEAHSEKPASPPTSSPKPHLVTGIGIKPLEPAVAAMHECPCVNPTKDDCAKIAPSGVHTRGTGAAAQFSRCRFYEIRMAVENKRQGRFNGPSMAALTPALLPAALGRGRRRCPGCGDVMGGPYTHCKACRAKPAA